MKLTMQTFRSQNCYNVVMTASVRLFENAVIKNEAQSKHGANEPSQEIQFNQKVTNRFRDTSIERDM